MVLCGLLATACAPAADADLLHLRGITSEVLESGDSLGILGDALPLDRGGRCQLVGQLHAPGRAPQSVDVEVPLRVTSGSMARTAPLARSASVFAQRGTFVGRVRVSFSSAASGASVAGASQVTGALANVRFDVQGDVASPLASQIASEHRACAFASASGLEFVPVDADGEGLSVQSVRPDSDAARAGLRPEDTLTALGELRLLALADFQPPPGSECVSLRFERAGVVQQASLGVGTSERDPLRGVALAFAGLLLCASLLLSPLTRLVDPARPALERAPRWRLRYLLYAGIAFGLLCAAARALAWLDLDLLASSGLLVLLGGAAAFGDRSTRFGSTLRVLRRVLVVEAPTLAIVAIALLSFGASRLSELALVQIASPLPWALGLDPLATVAAAAFFVALARGATTTTTTTTSRARLLLFSARRLWGAALFVALFCGGSSLDLHHPAGALRFAFEAVIVWSLIEWAAHDLLPRGRLLLPGLALATFALSLAPDPVRASLPRGAELAAGLLLTLALFGLVFASRLRRRTPPRWLVHPFL